MSDDRRQEPPGRSAPGEPLRADHGLTDSDAAPGEFTPGGEPSLLPEVERSPDSHLRARPHPSAHSAADGAGTGGSPPKLASTFRPGGSSATAPAIGSARFTGSADDQTHISKRAPLSPTPGGSLQLMDSHRVLEGERLEHFELQKLVGGGGMGAVFRALDTRLNRTVALKILAQDQAIDEEKIRRFRNEAQSAARLDHENVARVYYVGEDRGLHFIAFEYIDGTNIRDLVEARGPLPIDDALTYTYQIAEALAHADSREVVHRDIKPSNVIITAEGRAKLVDMGLARLSADDRSGTDLTASGVTLGTFDYISPEQALDPRNADARSDIYSLGCTVYFMLTGQPPFPEGSPLQKLLHHHSEKPPDPRELNRNIPDALAALVQQMMAKDPAARPPTPTALVRELVQLASDLGLTLPANIAAYPSLARPLRQVLEKQLPWLVPVTALLIVVAVLEAMALWPSGGSNVALGPPPRPLAEDAAPTSDTALNQRANNPAGVLSASPTLGNSRGAQTNNSQANDGRGNGKAGTNAAGATPTVTDARPLLPATNGSASTTPADNRNPRSLTNGRDADSLPRQPISSRVGESSQDQTTSQAAQEISEALDPLGEYYEESAADDFFDGVAKSQSGGNRATASEPLVSSEADSRNSRQVGTDRGPVTLFPGFDASSGGSLTDNGTLTGGIDLPVTDGASATASSPNTADLRPRENIASAPAAAPNLPAGRPGLRIVDPVATAGDYVYPTLRAACAVAQDGDVIELRWNGVREERPMESRNRQLTIRAAENFRPIVRFRPVEVDPLKHPRQMITAAGGRLTLVNLALEMDLSLAMPAEGWSLFEIQQAELVRLEHCSLTIRNTSEQGSPQHADVTFFKVDAPPGTTSMMTQTPTPALPTMLELQDSIARGEAVLLRVNNLQPVSLTWQNGFLATGQRLLVAGGGAKEPQQAGKIRLDLRHLTAAVRDGLCLLSDSADAPYQLSTEIRCCDSIVIAGPHGALVEQSGVDTVADFRSRLKWESDRNFYDGFSVFWKIRGKSALAAVEEMTLSPWNAFWGGRERSWGRVVWREAPDLMRPPHLQTVADFALDEKATDNPAHRGASDGRDVGCEAALLPVFPSRAIEENSASDATRDDRARAGRPADFLPATIR